jgi:hypothetical protein
MNVRATFFFSLGFYSWTESWWLTGLTNLQAAVAPSIVHANARVALLGYNASLDNIRLTNSDAVRQVLYVPPNSFTHTPSLGAVVLGVNTADEAYSCVVIRCTNVDGFTKFVYMSGYPDGVAITGQVVVPTFGVGVQWQAAFNTYASMLINNNWNWRYKIPAKAIGVAQNIIGIQVNALPPGEVGILLAPGAPVFQPGDEIQITGATRIQGRAARQLNGFWTVASVLVTALPTPGTLYYLRGSQGVDTTQLMKLGTAGLIDFGYRKVAVAIPEEETHRKRGVRTARPLGRSKIR